MKTYPCVVRGNIIELTEDQMKAFEWSQMDQSDKINELKRRIERLEMLVLKITKENP